MEFHNLSFDTEIDDMDEDEVRATLTDFMAKHTENTEAFNDLMQKVEDAPEAGENDAEFEALQTEVSEFKAEFATELAERVPLTVDELAEFSLARLYEMDAQTTPEAPEVEAEAEADTPEEPTREDKKSKAGDFSEDDDAVLRARAQERLSGMSGILFD